MINAVAFEPPPLAVAGPAESLVAIMVAGIVGLVGSWLITGQVRRYALIHSLLDIPNHRSSHAIATPRGGGLAIGAICLGSIAAAGGVGIVARETAFAMVGGGGVVAGIGWIDDRREVSSAVRAALHLVAACWAVFCLDGVPTLNLGSTELELGITGSIFAVLAISWLTNLYNFMDGIDGLAAGEAVSVGAMGGILLLLSGNAALGAVSFQIAAASAGFLWWNWAPAKIFMGDVGSGLLGYLFGVLAFASDRGGGVPFLIWVLLLGVFVLDGTVTLVGRILRGERWYAAHRSHAYQRAVQAGYSHAHITALLVGLNFALGAIAFTVHFRPDMLISGMLAAAVLLAGVYGAVERLKPM